MQGQKFTVYTDNSALTHLKGMHEKSKRLTKWSQIIERWQCDIIHVPGKKNWLADCLSRAPLAEEIDNLDSPEESYTPIFSIAFVNNILELLRKEQKKDEECKKIVADMKRRRGPASSFQNYSLKDGILYRMIIPFEDPEVVEAFKAQGNIDSEGIWSVPYVPVNLRVEVMKFFHNPPERAHFGNKKTSYMIKQKFFWNNMNRDIKVFVKSCEICHQFKSENQKKKGLMGNVPIATSVFETVYIDFIGPLPTSKSRNKYCLVLVDQLSGWVELKGMACSTSKKVIDYLEETFCRFGVPRFLISDNATYFVSKNMRRFLKEWNVKHRLASAYHAQVNRSERTNKDLVRMIASYFSNQQTEWDKFLQHFALALRSHFNATTKIPPSLLMLGRHIQYPIDRVLKTSSENLIEIVKQNMYDTQERNKQYYDQSHRPFEFNVGDLVLVRNNQRSDSSINVAGKLLPKWIGPYKIVIKNGLSYVLDMERQYTPKRHVSDLKPYFKPILAPPPPVCLSKVQVGKDPEVPIRMQLRNRARSNYRVLAGYKDNFKNTK